MPMTNRERIEAEAKARQQAGKPTMTNAERQAGNGGTARTNTPYTTPDQFGALMGEKPMWVAPAIASEDPSVIATRQAEFDRQQTEKQRARGRASTLLNGGQGVLSSANTGRASLLGY